MSKCDKCNQEVPYENSALVLEEYLVGHALWWAKDRHLYPVAGCEGSPSRVKKLESGDQAYLDAYEKLKETF